MFEQILPWLNLMVRPFQYVTSGGERIFWLYLMTALMIAAVAYLRRNPEEEKSLGGLFRWCFPARVYLHKSAINDYKYFIINAVFFLGVIVPVTGALSMALSNAVQTGASVLGFSGLWDNHNIWPASIAFTLLYGVLVDFTLFYVHYLEHKMPWLWEFHKVHHSAEVLEPLTVYRMHPLDDLMTVGATAAVAGLLDGFFKAMFVGPVVNIGMYGVNIFLILFYLIGYNLRHSEVWVDYGKFWDRIFISPAQHQIHHSRDPKHYDKNMGFIFALWDRWFHTLYVPEKEEKLEFGINRAGEEKEYSSVFRMYTLPFRKLGRKWSPRQRKAAVAAAIVIFLVYGYSGATFSQQQTQASVFIEDMTWPEIRSAIDSGKNVAIVPSGGTEQNGPHMILGKHNYIVKQNAGRIAALLGNALVAPVIAYVPEGSYTPPDGHMRFAGTMSVPEPVYEAVLEAAARSLKTHGFKLICFIGDHGWDLEGQKKVADKLNAEWKNQDVRVASIDQYYLANGQNAYLLSNGYSPEAIGTHAAIRDTSELMAAHPAGVRSDLRKPGKDGDGSGVIGDPTRASAAVGQALLNMKVQVATRQIRQEYAALVRERQTAKK